MVLSSIVLSMVLLHVGYVAESIDIITLADWSFEGLSLNSLLFLHFEF